MPKFVYVADNKGSVTPEIWYDTGKRQWGKNKEPLQSHDISLEPALSIAELMKLHPFTAHERLKNE